jgi:hypothetical protein
MSEDTDRGRENWGAWMMQRAIVEDLRRKGYLAAANEARAFAPSMITAVAHGEMAQGQTREGRLALLGETDPCSPRDGP